MLALTLMIEPMMPYIAREANKTTQRINGCCGEGVFFVMSDSLSIDGENREES
jgi:hypothetical protein